uniref:BRO1 domain-containing protein n=1 Tax=Dracunculus medinensis TaxID=318479 RepID=A0A0N4U137_DRAME
LDLAKRYYAQLLLMKSRFPMEEGGSLQVPFIWFVLFISFCFCFLFYYSFILFHSILFSIKSAFTHFQWAAYPFQYIRNNTDASKYSAIDFDSSSLTFYTNVFLAQAQECILEKSLVDHRKNLVIAKIAIYLRDIYKLCREILESSEFLRLCDIKSDIYGAIAMIELGEKADQDKKMGLRLSYYQVAAKHVKSALKLCEKDKRTTLKQAVNFVNDIVTAKETNAQKENDFIYHEKIPRHDELDIVEGVCMVKAIELDPTDPSIAGDDLFSGLIPMKALKSVSFYSEEKAKLKRSVIERVEKKNKDEYLISLQLDEIHIDESVDEMKLPDMLLERSAAFTSHPDSFPDLLDKLQRVLVIIFLSLLL